MILGLLIMNSLHPHMHFLFSLLFFLIILALFLYFGTVNFDYIFCYSFFNINFYYSLLVYWYGTSGYYALICGVCVSIMYVFYAIFAKEAISKKVLFILPLSPLSGSLLSSFYCHDFVSFGFVGQAGEAVLRYYCNDYAYFYMIILEVLYVFLSVPLSWSCKIYSGMLFIIKKIRIIDAVKYMWNNFLLWIYFIFRINSKKMYIDDLIKLSLEKDFELIIEKYPFFKYENMQTEKDSVSISYLKRYLNTHSPQLQGEMIPACDDMSVDEIHYFIDALNHFDIVGIVEKTFCGPYLNTVIFTPDVAVKIQSIFAMQNDFGRVIGRPEIRFVYPVKNFPHSIAIEYPHYRITNQYFLPYFVSDAYAELPALMILLGLDSHGSPFYFDLKQAPHVLLAGTTGSGKSSILHSIIFNFLWKYTSQEVVLFLIDPKKSEFFLFSSFPMVLEIAYTIEEIISVLKKIIDMMEDRYAFFQKNAYKNIDESIQSYNKLPYVVVIIDEYADIVLQSKLAEQYCLRLLQMARAAGIFLIIATQRPSSDIVTGTLKSNLPARICCRVINQVNSRIVLDIDGAEKLLGKGDMIFLFQGTYTRLHGFYIDSGFIASLLQ